MEKRRESFIRMLDELGYEPQHAKLYLLIPLKGCSECVDDALEFMSANKESKNIKFIISSNEAKLINIKIGSLKNAPSVIIDVKNLTEKEGFTSFGTIMLIKIMDNKSIETKSFIGSSIKADLRQLKESI
jgi:hypothetical protein